MFLEPRTKSLELSIYEALEGRMILPDADQKYYLNLRKGFEGESGFDLLLERLGSERYILSDLLLNMNHTSFQIDSLMITPEKIHLFEVKNYEGDFMYDNEKFYRLPRSEILNPLHQLRRAELLLGQMLKRLRSPYPIQSTLIFTHPHFTLYQSPLNEPIIFPGQLDRFMKELDHQSGPQMTRKHKQLAEELIKRHVVDSPARKLPVYKFDELHKGVRCLKCGFSSMVVSKKFCICEGCGAKELYTAAVMRGVRELSLLFPDLKLTTSIVSQWCGGLGSVKRVRHVLLENLVKVGDTSGRFYQ